MKKYVVRNIFTNAICGIFDTANEAGKWVEKYVHEQNQGTPHYRKEYCSPFHFSLKEEVISRIDSYEDACLYLGINRLYLDGEIKQVETPSKHYKALAALAKLFVIAEAWNKEDGFVPDFSNEEQWKYYPWFKYDKETARFVCSISMWPATDSTPAGGSHLCFATRERARAFGKMFESLYNDILLLK